MKLLGKKLLLLVNELIVKIPYPHISQNIINHLYERDA